jgi:osmotically-inducible protein OsmY
LNTGGLTSNQLHQRIDAALHSEPTLSGSNLTVNVSDDSIDLSGTVTSSKDRVTARRIVQSFAGNRRVRERVTVGGARSSNPAPNGLKDESATPKAEKSEKGEVENVNRPITDPAKHGDASEEPRRK